MLATLLTNRFFDRLAVSPRGRAFIFDLLIGAEDGDEAGVFDHMLELVEDPDLHRMVRRHRDDETEHAAIFRACRAALPVPADAVPEPARIIRYISAELGPPQGQEIDERKQVMESFALLQVIEERGVEQYPLIARAMAKYDPSGAAAISAVANDEVRHVKYCKAISKRYAPDEATLARTLAHMRQVEARAFDIHGRAFLVQAVDADLVRVWPGERMIWRSLAAMQRRHMVDPRDVPGFSPTMKGWSEGSA